MKKLLTAISFWLALSGAALAQCTGGISGCPQANTINSTDLFLLAQPGGTGPTGFITRKATFSQITTNIAATVTATILSGPNTWLQPQTFSLGATFNGAATFNGGIGGSGPVNMLNTTTPASFTTPGYSFNDVGVIGFNFSDTLTHIGTAITGSSPSTGTGSYVGAQITQFGSGRTSSSFVTGAVEASIATGGSGNYTGANPYVVVCGTAVIAGQCPYGIAATLVSAVGMEIDFFSYTGAATVYKEGLRIVDAGVVQASGAGNLSAAITVVRAASSPGFVYGLYFGDPTLGDASFPLTTTGSPIKLSTAARAIDSIIDGSGLAGGVTNGAIRLPDGVTGFKWPSWSLLETSSLIAFQTSGGVNAALFQTAASLFSGTIQSGLPGATGGALILIPSAGGGSHTQQLPGSLAGTPVVTWGSSSGTPPVTASAPLAIVSGTGNITCTGCLTNTIAVPVTISTGVLATGVSALTVNGTLPNLTGAQVGFSSTIGTSAGTTPTIIAGFNITLGTGYTGSGDTIGVLMTDNVSGTASTVVGAGAPHGNTATQATSQGITTGANFGHTGSAFAGDVNVGSAGYAYVPKATSINIGIVADALNSGGGSMIGALITLHGTLPAALSSALIVDNGAQAVPIALWRNAGSTVASVTQTGGLTATLPASAGAGGIFVCVDTSGVFYKKATCP